ncbi:hypothetical protein CR513_30250, partial [Mucuna pruriens]
MKTRQCIFIGYGHDEYGYRMYDLVEKKLVKSRDVQFMEDQTIEDIDKEKKPILEKDNSLSEIDPVRMPIQYLDTANKNVQNDDQHNYVGDQQLRDGFDVPPNDDVEKEQEMSQDESLSDALEPPPIQLRRSNRHRQSSIRYTSNEYVTLTDGGEPECYQEFMESEESHRAIHLAVGVAKVHTHDIGANMMTKVVPRGKFEAYCEIAGLAITST